MMPEPGSSSRWSASQPGGAPRRAARARRGCRLSRSSGPRSTSGVRPPPVPSCSATSAVTRALAVAVVASTGTPRRQLGEQGAQPAVVGPEVVAPVGDAVRLVDHQQAGRRGELRQHVVAEVGVVQPLGADQQHVHRARGDLRLDGVPLLEVGRVDRPGGDAGPGGRLDLVAHQREQRRDDHRGARAARPAAARSRRSRPRTCPSRCAARPAPAGGRRPAPRSPATGPRAAARCPWRPRRDGPGPHRPRYAVARCSCAPCPHTTGRVGQSRNAPGLLGPSRRSSSARGSPPQPGVAG